MCRPAIVKLEWVSRQVPASLDSWTICSSTVLTNNTGLVAVNIVAAVRLSGNRASTIEVPVVRSYSGLPVSSDFAKDFVARKDPFMGMVASVSL